MTRFIPQVVLGITLLVPIGCDPAGTHSSHFETIHNLGGGEPGWIKVDISQAGDAVRRDGLRTVHRFDTVESFTVFKPVKIMVVPQDASPDGE